MPDAQRQWDAAVGPVVTAPERGAGTASGAVGIANSLLARAAVVRNAARTSLDARRKEELGQYFTPVWVAQLMASMIEDQVDGEHMRILDPGAGAGTLFAAYVARCLVSAQPPASISVTAFEIDRALMPFLEMSAHAVRRACHARAVECHVKLRARDFAAWASGDGFGSIFGHSPRFDAAILNPPYKKLASDSGLRARLDTLGFAAPNLYAAFLGLAVHVVKPGGAVVAIVPRSFCNGPYFKRFRRHLFASAAIWRVHLFSRRDRAFKQDAVLQENVVLALRLRPSQSRSIHLSFNDGMEEDPIWSREARRDEIVHDDDDDFVVRLPSDRWGRRLARSVGRLPSSLREQGLEVSTGRVVGFRLRDHFAPLDGPSASAPLLHPANFRDLRVHWPVRGNKPQALALSDKTKDMMIPSGWYVVTKRFTTKEEARRVVASIVDPSRIPADYIALENHLNYFHRRGGPLKRVHALGLATFLNSTWIDSYFRQFSGHTQVNAADLRKLRYPDSASLSRLGAALEKPLMGQEADNAIRTHCKEAQDMPEPNYAQDRIDEAVAVLRALGLPKGQQNERSALALLALLRLQPNDSWEDASKPLLGVMPIMEWTSEHYGRTYAPNTRETFRRFTLHQFVDAGVVLPNPDQPDRPVNSPKYCYQIEGEALALLKTFGTKEWARALTRYQKQHESLKVRYAQLRRMTKIPLVLKNGIEIKLTPGGQTDLVRLVIEEFCPRFVAGGEPVHVGDAGDKWAFLDQPLAAELGIDMDRHGKMPDVIVYDRARDWLFLVEAVTSHGPVDAKRRAELSALLAGARPGLVFVTAFLDRRSFIKYATEIAWRTEVWIADSPDHLLHFDGERFLGPYDDTKDGR